MRTIAEDQTLSSLVERLSRLLPDTPRRWGTLKAAEMLCHLGDAHESVLGTRIPPGPPASGVSRPFLKWIVLYVPVPWPKGAKTRPGVDPRIQGSGLVSMGLSTCHLSLAPVWTLVLLEVSMAHINDCVPGRQARIRQTGVSRVAGKTGIIIEVSRIRRPPTGPLQDRVTVDIPAHGEIVVTPDDIEVLPT